MPEKYLDFEKCFQQIFNLCFSAASDEMAAT